MTKARLELDHVQIQGAEEHNLKRVNVEIPKKQLVVLTGVSGSGKSSLAFDTLYAEGQRRYIESLSAYARQFLGQMDKPRYESIRGLGPTIAIEQKTTGTNPRSTVGTITEISDYLRVLYARAGEQHCHRCGRKVAGQSPEQIAKEIQRWPSGTKVTLLAPLLTNRKGEHRELLARAKAEGFVRLRIDGELRQTEEIEALDKKKKHDVDAVVDRLILGTASAARLSDSIEFALKTSKGVMIAQRVLAKKEAAGKGTAEKGASEGTAEDVVFSENLACEACGISFPELSPQGFSFNNPQGMCQECNGLGTRAEMDLSRVVPDDTLSIDAGAIAPWGEDVSEKSTWEFRDQLLKHLGIDSKKPLCKLSPQLRQALFYGTGDKKYQVTWNSKSGEGKFQVQWEGVLPRLMRRFRQTSSERARKWYAQFMGTAPCSACKGSRLRPESAAVQLGGKTLVEVSRLTVSDALEHFRTLKLDESRQTIAKDVIKELCSRLGFLHSVGLGYLSLDRAGPTLSGGEAQRIRLASQVGSELSGVIYVLDEPSIGLHQRDNQRLLETLLRLRDIGNTVVCVEHDEETIRSADHVIDFGPGAGVDGGHIVYSGDLAGLLAHSESLTGAYLSGKQRIEPSTLRTPQGWVRLLGAAENNLKRIDVDFPLGVLVAVTGVSGAGKSTLVNDVLCPAMQQHLGNATVLVGKHKKLVGAEQIDRLITIDQRPIGRTPRSNPITYIKVFDEIRRFFSELPEAKARGYRPGRFSFNVKGGRCEACEGDGVRKIEMHFLADVYVKCEECNGKRYNESTLAVRYKGKSISDVLEMTVKESLELFAVHPSIAGPLQLLAEVGLAYLPLGQPSPTLSGGEAQRIKLARELAKRDTGSTLYVLDEPTTGLHFDDVRKLLDVLHRLVDAGNTVLVIEHNLDVIRAADYLVDLGPDGGPSGGYVIAVGPPNAVVKCADSATGEVLRRSFSAVRPRSRQGK